MLTILQTVRESAGTPVVVCDFSPPRGGSPSLLESARDLDADFISVAYSPGKSSRVSPLAAALWIHQNTGKNTVFTLATRDMNKLAIQNLLLGAQLHGLNNVVVVQGDPFSRRELERVQSVGDYTTTGLIGAIHAMNRGVDFKGLKLRDSTSFCVGATLDLMREHANEARLTRRKIDAGAQFLLAQPAFSAQAIEEFSDVYSQQSRQPIDVPIFHGVQILAQDGVLFSSVPDWAASDLQNGRSGVDIAMQIVGEYRQAGLSNFYLIPPIFRGGVRDYDAAKLVLEKLKNG